MTVGDCICQMCIDGCELLCNERFFSPLTVLALHALLVADVVLHRPNLQVVEDVWSGVHWAVVVLTIVVYLQASMTDPGWLRPKRGSFSSPLHCLLAPPLLLVSCLLCRPCQGQGCTLNIPGAASAEAMAVESEDPGAVELQALTAPDAPAAASKASWPSSSTIQAADATSPGTDKNAGVAETSNGSSAAAAAAAAAVHAAAGQSVELCARPATSAASSAALGTDQPGGDTSSSASPAAAPSGFGAASPSSSSRAPAAAALVAATGSTAGAAGTWSASSTSASASASAYGAAMTGAGAGAGASPAGLGTGPGGLDLAPSTGSARQLCATGNIELDLEAQPFPPRIPSETMGALESNDAEGIQKRRVGGSQAAEVTPAMRSASSAADGATIGRSSVEGLGDHVCGSPGSAVPDHRRWCKHCEAYQPLRTKHCRDCEVCVRTHDHHCPWLGTCVGENNRPLFYVYLVLQCLELALFFVEGLRGISILDPSVLLILGLLFIALFFIMVAMLLGFHTFLLLGNLTTWEHSSWRRITYMKRFNPEKGTPFGRSVSANVAVYCFGPKWCPDRFRLWAAPRRDVDDSILWEISEPRPFNCLLACCSASC